MPITFDDPRVSFDGLGIFKDPTQKIIRSTMPTSKSVRKEIKFREIIPKIHFKMNDNADNPVVVNSGSLALNGVASANTSTLTAEGKINTALSFDGSSTYMTADDSASAVALNTTGSLAFWFKPNAVTTADVPFSFSDGTTSNRLYLIFAGTNPLFRLQTGGTTVWSIGLGLGFFTNDQWYHIAVVQNGVSVVVYVDNVLFDTLGSNTSPGAWLSDLSNEATSLNIGREYSGGTTYTNCVFDDFRYYDEALSSAMIAQLYNGGDGTEDVIYEGSQIGVSKQIRHTTNDVRAYSNSI